MKFLTENHLREYASVITTQVQIILKKWKAKSRLGLAKEVNVHYDLITLKLDIIMITAFGAGTQHLSQNLPANQNMQVVGGDEKVQERIEYKKKLEQEIYRYGLQRIETEVNPPNTMLSEMIKLKSHHNLSDSEISDELLTIRGRFNYSFLTPST